MKFFLASVLFCAVSAIAVFGFVAMAQSMEHGHLFCFAVTLGGATCPEEVNILDSLAVHLNAIKGFSAAVFISTFLSLLLVFAWFVSILSGGSPGYMAGMYAPARICRAVTSRGRTKFLKWLSFQEHSPTIF